jgi:hypothetical protein
MARIRQIKPEFFLDDELATTSRDGRLLFIGLWTIADREGRLEDRPGKIKAQIFPYDVDLSYQKIDALLSNLYELNFIIRYQINTHKYIQIRSFSKHQHCHVKESPSTIQAPDLSGAPGTSTVLAPVLHRTSTYTSTSTSTSTCDLRHAASTCDMQPKNMEASQASPLGDPGIVPPQKERPKDEAYELFVDNFKEQRKIPYRMRNGKDGDFVQLAHLRKQLGIGTRETPKDWGNAIANYLSSPLTTYTLADLCVRYDMFVLGEVDRFGRPAGYNDVRQANRETIGKLAEKGFFNE